MGFSVTNNKIKLTRGDTFRVRVEIKAKGEPYTPQEGDSVRFAVKKDEFTGRQYKELIDVDPLILKDIPIDTLILQLDPEDTKDLPFGKYLYDVELTKADGDVDTFIKEQEFILTTEVH